MYEVNIFNRSNNKIFTKRFNNKKALNLYVRKIGYSNSLILLSITDNSYLYD